MTTKSATIALLGAPNVGKSTFINQVVGQKISIVTPKVQTTRNTIRAIYTKEQTQLVLIDTPGVFVDPKNKLERLMVNYAWQGVEEADQVVFLIDAKHGICRHSKAVLKALQQRNKQATLIINKIDKVSPEMILPLAKTLNESDIFSHTFMISALKGKGVDDVLQTLCKECPPSPWLFPEDQIATAPLRFLATEITREKLFLALDKELPYHLAVEAEQWQEDDRSITIHQVIYVTKDSHKAIILGKGGKQIKRIGSAAREELKRMLDKRVSLFLFVKVREKWREQPERLVGEV